MSHPFLLDASPVASLRRKYGLSRQQAGQKLKMPRRHVALLEMQTQGIPAFVLDAIDRALSPDAQTQLDFLELVLNQAGAIGNVNAPGLR